MSVNLKPRLLYITGINPSPSQGGGELRVFKTIISLSKFYRMTALLVAPVAELPKELVAVCEEIISIPIAPKKSFRACLFGQPYWLSEWFNHEVLLQVDQLQRRETFSAVQIDSTQLLYVLDAIQPKQLTFFTAFDIGTVSFWRRNQEQKNLLKRMLGYLGVLQVYWYEKKYLALAKTVLVVSNTDREKMRQIFAVEADVVPNAYDAVGFVKKKESAALRLGFIGGTSHSPNRQAISYLVNEISNSLIKDNFNFKIVLAGDIDTSIISANNLTLPHVRVLGQIAQLSDFYQNIDVLVAPLKSGSGTRIKILESLAYKTPVITTAVGAEGIESTNIHLAENVQEFNSRIKNFAKIPVSQRFKVEPNAIQTWTEVFEKLYKLIESKQ